MNLRVIIADDEPLARERVRMLLANEPDVEVVAECANGEQTIKSTRELKPDLLFLDIQMPRKNGFEVLAALQQDELPTVIFTTAHDEHAIHAFEVNALDYLLKPCTEDRFKKALLRARSHIAGRRKPGSDSQLTAFLQQLRAGSGAGRILIKSADRILFLKPEEIDHIEAAGNYVILQAGKDRHIVRETTSAMEARLAPAGFMRISRSVIVNLSRIREIQPVAPGQFSLLLKTGARFDMTCSLKELQNRLSTL